MTIIIESARYPEDADAVLFLFRGYAASLGIDLSYQQFQHELDSLPGKYTECERGALLIAHSKRKECSNQSSIPNPSSPTPQPPALGCVALRRNSDDWCEMKRLYVVGEARGEHLGERLVESILAQAKALGYRGIRLDTLHNMTAAQRLYRKYGFIEIPPYYDTPVEGTIFMGCEFSPVE